MSVGDPLPDGDEFTVSRRVRSAVVVVLWLPVVIILLGSSVALAAFLVRYSLYGPMPDLSNAASSFGGVVDPGLVALGVLAAVGFLYLVLARATFGGETVEAAQEQAEELADRAEDGTDGGGNS